MWVHKKKIDWHFRCYSFGMNQNPQVDLIAANVINHATRSDTILHQLILVLQWIILESCLTCWGREWMLVLFGKHSEIISESSTAASPSSAPLHPNTIFLLTPALPCPPQMFKPARSFIYKCRHFLFELMCFPADFRQPYHTLPWSIVAKCWNLFKRSSFQTPKLFGSACSLQLSSQSHPANSKLDYFYYLCAHKVAHPAQVN